jgi:hypothetical protein
MQPIEVFDRLRIGDLSCCRPGDEHTAVVHACKSPCHQRAVGYSGSLAASHPDYLWQLQPGNLFLNLIDPPRPLFKIESFHAFLRFAAHSYDAGAALLIHCNQGESRAPSLALLFLACHLRAIPRDSFAAAAGAFTRLYPAYAPGQGIRQFLTQHWQTLV